MVKKLLCCSIACLGFLVAAAPGLLMAADPPASYEVAETVHLGGKGGFDYVTLDRRNNRLYIPRSTHTQVLDTTTGKVVADIEGQKGNHGVALNRQAGRGFISDGPGFVVIFDTKTNAVLGQVKVDRGADGIINDNSTKKVYVACVPPRASFRLRLTSTRQMERPILRSISAARPNTSPATARGEST